MNLPGAPMISFETGQDTSQVPGVEEGATRWFRAVYVGYNANTDALVMTLSNGCWLGIPVMWFPELQLLRVSDLDSAEIVDGGDAIFIRRAGLRLRVADITHRFLFSVTRQMAALEDWEPPHRLRPEGQT